MNKTPFRGLLADQVSVAFDVDEIQNDKDHGNLVKEGRKHDHSNAFRPFFRGDGVCFDLFDITVQLSLHNQVDRRNGREEEGVDQQFQSAAQHRRIASDDAGNEQQKAHHGKQNDDSDMNAAGNAPAFSLVAQIPAEGVEGGSVGVRIPDPGVSAAIGAIDGVFFHFRMAMRTDFHVTILLRRQDSGDRFNTIIKYIIKFAKLKVFF